MAAYWGIAAHSAYDIFSWYKYIIVNLVFPIPRFVEWEFLSDCASSWSLPTCTFLSVFRQMTDNNPLCSGAAKTPFQIYL